MNLVLLFDDDFISNQRVSISDRRFQHITSIHRVAVGDQLTVGRLNGNIGKGTVVQLDSSAITLDVELLLPPPPALPVTLILALPRPQMLKRTLQTIATMGVKRLLLIHSNRVEKSFWQTPLLSEHNIRENLLLGLEQARDTILPQIEFHQRFKPLVTELAPELARHSTAPVAHPGPYAPCPTGTAGAITLAIGPEGGFITYEVEQLQEAGFEPISLGERILRVETAVPVLLAKLF